MPATSFHLADQLGWAHDEGHPAGTFHTFDRLDVGADTPVRKVHVFLPRSYTTARRAYPVVWMNDGDTAFWAGGVARKTWDVAGALSRLNGAAEVIVVAVHPTERDAEYTHVDWRRGRAPFGGLPRYASYLASDLRLFLARHYRMSPDPRHHLALGSSHGGLAAFWTATRHPDRFGGAACLSTSFFAGLDDLDDGPGPGPLADAPLLADAAALLVDRARRPRLYLSWGLQRSGGPHNEVVEAFAERRGEEAAALLTDRYGYRQARLTDAPSDAELMVYVDESGGHDEAAWAAQLDLILPSFFPA